MSEPKTPKVTLLTWTVDPLETVYAVWESSKGEAPLMTTQQVKETVPPDEVEKLFRAVIGQRIPVGEHLDFVFVLENISISLREQIVRHRIGTTASPERLGADIVVGEIPDLPSSSFWSQSMRIQDMGLFATNGAYRLPETVMENPRARLMFEDHMEYTQSVYNTLVSMGIPMEDAREVMPLGAQHRMSWRLNTSSLQHIVSKRGCWILQLGIWGPIILGMIEELATKIHPVFRDLVAPPCVHGDKFTGCVYHEECRRRYTGDDRLPPCPLHLANHQLGVLPGNKEELARLGEQAGYPRIDEMVKRIPQYESFWGRDVVTGKRLKVIQ